MIARRILHLTGVPRCIEALRMIPLELDGRLAARHRIALEAHSLLCKRCRRYRAHVATTHQN